MKIQGYPGTPSVQPLPIPRTVGTLPCLTLFPTAPIVSICTRRRDFSRQIVLAHRGRLPMNLAYFDCFSGISGDMTLGALLDAGCDVARFRSDLQSLQVPGLGALRRKSLEKWHGRDLRQGQNGRPEHASRLTEILEILKNSDLAPQVRDRASADLPEARRSRSPRPRRPARQNPFPRSRRRRRHRRHRRRLHRLSHTRHRQIRLLSAERRRRHRKNGPRRSARPRSGNRELAERQADLFQRRPARTRHAHRRRDRRHALRHFGPQPPMTVSAIGYGAGTADLEGQPNVVRIMIGEPPKKSSPASTKKSPSSKPISTT